MLLDGLIQVLEYVSGEILAVIQFGEVVNELGARHLPTNVLAVQVRIEQHNGTGQSMDSILAIERARITV